MSKPVITIENLSVGFNEALIDDFNLIIQPGEIVAITGSSGLGKTTLLRTIAGLIPKISGSIIGDVETRGGVGYIPQRLGLVRHASVYHNVELGARSGIKVREDGGNIFNWGKRKNVRIEQCIELMGLTEKIDEPIRRLSGGQQRRVATARTLAQRPKLILADEFLSELDKGNADSIIKIIRNYVQENQSSMLLVEHHLDRAEKISDRIIDLENYAANFLEQE